MQKPADSQTRLLVVDDEPEVLEAIRLMAMRDGYDVKTASTAREFLIACKTFDPDLMLIDVVMPEIDGVELLRHLSETGCGARIVLMSGYSRGTMRRALDMGDGLGLKCTASLTKPLARQALRDALGTPAQQTRVAGAELAYA